ncbi:MAG: S8 family serine peptidase [Flammeovirgaceae bacterium]|nr:S8 family serine peptidase [Flammeovirgaceae bacterium]
MRILKFNKTRVHSFAQTALFTVVLYLFHANQHAYTQNNDLLQDWWLSDTETDGVAGVGFYKILKNLKPNTFSGKMIIAVLDTGTDTSHHTINPYLYVNTKEITGNGKDDDNNGYIDDRHGWNFLGGPTGNLIHDTPEVVREYVRLSKKSKNPSNSLSNKEWAYFREVSEKYERDKNGNKKKLEEYRQAHVQYQQITGTLNTCKRILERELSGKNLSYRGIKELMPKTDSAQFAKAVLMQIMEATDTTLLIQETQNELKQAEEDLGNLVRDYSIAVSLYDTTWRPRQIIGDTENNEEKFYGNADVRDPTGHGTSVAGIMALLLQKLNEQGHRVPIKILPVRIVPSAGDERDKDIANGIVYAVNQGAKIINLSFGKYYSPYPEVVQQAILYGTEKDVLFVHAAGNEGINIDSRSHFPLPPKQNLETAWIEVGASGPTLNETLAASFSNYGKKTVDLYAPGVDLYCPTLQNKFGYSQGTSLAAPVVSICAALLWSYNTKFKALDVKDKLISNTKKYKTQVYIPKLKKHVPFNELSKSGGILWLPGIFSKD